MANSMGYPPTAKLKPEITGWATCCAETKDGGVCGYPADRRGLPFPLCDEHAVSVYRYVASTLAENRTGPPPPNKKYPETSVVYYAQIGEHIKIGHTKNLTTRMAAYPPSAKLLAVEPGDTALETQRHRRFQHLLAARKEWFYPGDDLMEHILHLAATVKLPVAV